MDHQLPAQEVEPLADTKSEGEGQSTNQEIERTSCRLIKVSNAHITAILDARPPAKPKPKTPANVQAKFARVYALVAAYRKQLGERGKGGTKRTFAARLGDYKLKGSSEWRMRQGIAHAKGAGHYNRRLDIVVDRGEVRSVPVEDLMPAIDEGYTSMPEWALDRALNRSDRGFDEKAFALAVVVRKSPTPMILDEVCRRLGVDGEKTKRRMMRDASAVGLIAAHKGPNGVNWLGRPDAIDSDFARAIEASRATSVRNHKAGQNHKGQKPVTYCLRKEGTTNNNNIRLALPKRNVDSQDQREWEKDYDEFLAPLANWRKTVRVADRDGDERYGQDYFTTPGGAPPSVEEKLGAPYTLWLEHVTCYGRHLPPRLHEKFAWHQAIDLGRELVHRANGEIALPEAVIAIARFVANEWRTGNSVRSFGYFALNKFLDRLWHDDLTCIFDVPSKFNVDEFQIQRRNAELATRVAARHHEIDYDRLTSTIEVENLDAILRALGDGEIRKGWTQLQPAISRIPRRLVTRWSTFATAVGVST